MLYEINTRVWLAELSARFGRRITLDTIPAEEIERIVGLGFDGLWLMGFWTTGPAPIAVARTHPDLQKSYREALPDFTPDDVIGSPYAVSNYLVSEKLGGPQALAALRERLARQGIRIMLDFVCNHTACDHPFVERQPELFIQGSEADIARDRNAFFGNGSGAILAHGRDPYFPPWTDTAQLNYANPATRDVMLNELLSIAAQCDGVRCDMAMLILPEIVQRIWNGRLGANANLKSFWKDAIEKVVARHPNFIFLGEAYWGMEQQLQQEGFHFTYDKTLYDRLRAGDFREVRRHLSADSKYQEHCARFIENHDEPRAVTAFGAPGARSAAIPSFYSAGLCFFHDGQLEGRRFKVPVQLGRRRAETEDVETALFYDKVLADLADPTYRDGNVKLIEVRSSGWNDNSFESLIAFWWTYGTQGDNSTLGRLVIGNLSGSRAYGRIALPKEVFENGKQYLFLDQFDGKRYERDGAELLWPGLYVALEAHQPHLFKVCIK